MARRRPLCLHRAQSRPRATGFGGVGIGVGVGAAAALSERADEARDQPSRDAEAGEQYGDGLPARS